MALNSSSWRWSARSPKTQSRELRRPSTAPWSHHWRIRLVDTTGTINTEAKYHISHQQEWHKIFFKTEHLKEINLKLLILFPFAHSDCAPAKCSAAGKDDDLAQKLWELSCRLLSITWEWGTQNPSLLSVECLYQMVQYTVSSFTTTVCQEMMCKKTYLSTNCLTATYFSNTSYMDLFYILTFIFTQHGTTYN